MTGLRSAYDHFKNILESENKMTTDQQMRESLMVNDEVSISEMGPCNVRVIHDTWLPIESAPKNGTDILLWDGYFIKTGAYDENYASEWADGNYAANSEIRPTHWMPLPQPPQGE